jgi:hypothetical protein
MDPVTPIVDDVHPVDDVLPMDEETQALLNMIGSHDNRSQRAETKCSDKSYTIYIVLAVALVIFVTIICLIFFLRSPSTREGVPGDIPTGSVVPPTEAESEADGEWAGWWPPIEAVAEPSTQSGTSTGIISSALGSLLLVMARRVFLS